MAVSLRSNCRFGLPDADGGNWWAHASTPTAHGPTRHAWSTLVTTLLNNEARQELAPTELDPAEFPTARSSAAVAHRARPSNSACSGQDSALAVHCRRHSRHASMGCINPGGVRSGERGIQLGATHAARSSIPLDAVSIGRLMTGAARRSAMSARTSASSGTESHPPYSFGRPSIPDSPQDPSLNGIGNLAQAAAARMKRACQRVWTRSGPTRRCSVIAPTTGGVIAGVVPPRSRFRCVR
jgi:hypothetical protein